MSGRLHTDEIASLVLAFREWVAWNVDGSEIHFPDLDFLAGLRALRDPAADHVIRMLIEEGEEVGVEEGGATPASTPTTAEDAGAYLPGARKHLWTPGARVTAADLDTIEQQPEGTIYKFLTKAYVFGPFPWEAERENEVSAQAAVFKEKIWHSVAQRPGNHAESRRLYVKGADWLKAELEKLKGPFEVLDFLDRWKVYVRGEDTTELLSQKEVADKLGLTIPYERSGSYWRSHSLTAIPAEVRKKVAELRLLQAQIRGGPDPEVTLEARVSINKQIEALEAPFKLEITNHELTKAGFTDLLHSRIDGPDGAPRWRLTFPRENYKEGRDNPKGYLFGLSGLDKDSDYREIKKQQLNKLVEAGGYGFSQTVRSSAHHATWEELLKDAPERTKSKPWTRATTDQRREGPPTKRPASFLGDEFVKGFNFHGDQFGEWVTQDERVKHRAFAWDAFTDLARIVGLRLDEMSACGKLGIAFGARGKGKASAHYESVNPITLKYLPVINLTNTRGDGSLAHEWGHFLDHHLSESPETVINTGDGITTSFLSGGRQRGRRATAGPSRSVSVREAMAKVLDAMERPDPETMASLRAEREQILRKAENEAKLLNAEYREKKIDRAAYEKGWDEVKQMRKNAPEYSKTRYMNDAEIMGDYWARPTEMFARAFESWIEDELSGRGEVNTYLVFGTQRQYNHHVVRAGVQVGPLEPYPQGTERTKINEAIRKLMAAVSAAGVLCKVDRVKQPYVRVVAVRSEKGTMVASVRLGGSPTMYALYDGSPFPIDPDGGEDLGPIHSMGWELRGEDGRGPKVGFVELQSGERYYAEG